LIELDNLQWQSDWDGEEVGFPESHVVGLYTSHELSADFYIDVEKNRILKIMPHEEDEE
jgi:hypothetical protein